jgi:hypothetical protein
MAPHNQTSSLVEIELVKTVNIWRVEEASARWVLLRRTIGCTASEKKDVKHKD